MQQPQPPVKPPTPEQPPGFPKPKPPLDNPRDEADQQIGQGVVAFRKKEYGLAAQRFGKAIELDPESALGYFLLSQAYFALGHYPEAVTAIHEGMKRRAAKIPPRARPRFTEAVERLVQLYEAWGKKDEAAKWRQELEAGKGLPTKGQQRPCLTAGADASSRADASRELPR